MWAIGDSTTGRGQDVLRGRVFLDVGTDVINSAQCPAAIRHNLLPVNSMQHATPCLSRQVLGEYAHEQRAEARRAVFQRKARRD